MGDYEAPPGWEEVEMNETNITELQTRSTLAFQDFHPGANNFNIIPMKEMVMILVFRMGHLLLDGVFDEEKYERGMIKLLRRPAEEEELEV